MTEDMFDDDHLDTWKPTPVRAIDPFEPTPKPAPKKRGRPATTKPKAASKPRFRLHPLDTAEITEKLMEIAWLIDLSCRSSKSAQLRVAAELLEMIENKKA